MKKILTVVTVLAVCCMSSYADGQNQFKYSVTKDKNGDGYPDGYEHKNGPKETISLVNEADGKALQFNSNEIVKYVRLRSPFQALKPATKYILTFDAKVSDLVTKKGKWPDGIRIWLRNAKGGYRFIGITGKGNTDSWVTAVLPFDTGADNDYTKIRVELQFSNMSGKVLIRNFVIKSVDAANFPAERSFMVGQKTIKGSVLKLK